MTIVNTEWNVARSTIQPAVRVKRLNYDLKDFMI